MNLQTYATTGRKYRPNYVDIVNARVKYLPEKKRLKDEQDYRNSLLAIEGENVNLAKDRLRSQENAATTSTAIGLGQLGLESYYGRKRDEKLTQILEGGGSKAAPEAAVSPEKVTDAWGGTYDFSGGLGGDVTPVDASKTEGIFSGLTKGVSSNWGPILSSTLTGGTAGAAIGEKIIGGKAGKIVGGGLTSGTLGYLSTGSPYEAGLSAIFGATLGGLF